MRQRKLNSLIGIRHWMSKKRTWNSDHLSSCPWSGSEKHLSRSFRFDPGSFCRSEKCQRSFRLFYNSSASSPSEILSPRIVPTLASVQEQEMAARSKSLPIRRFLWKLPLKENFHPFSLPNKKSWSEKVGIKKSFFVFLFRGWKKKSWDSSEVPWCQRIHSFKVSSTSNRCHIAAGLGASNGNIFGHGSVSLYTIINELLIPKL